MKLTELPLSGNQPKDVFEFEDSEKEIMLEVQGEMYPEENGDVNEGEDIAVYTNVKEERPWVGRVVKVFAKEVIVHWFSKKSRKYTYENLQNQDSTPMTDRIPRESIMYRCISSVSKDTSFQITPTCLSKIFVEFNIISRQIKNKCMLSVRIALT